MRAPVTFRGLATARVLTAVLVVGVGATALAQTPPAHMDLIIGQSSTAPPPGEQDVLALNVAMFGYYDRALNFYQQRLLGAAPVILALFSVRGRRLHAVPSRMAPLRAPSVPIAYQLLNRSGHSSMALFQIAGPYLDQRLWGPVVARPDGGRSGLSTRWRSTASPMWLWTRRGATTVRIGAGSTTWRSWMPRWRRA